MAVCKIWPKRAILGGSADLGLNNFSVKPFFGLKLISADAPSYTESKKYIVCLIILKTQKDLGRQSLHVFLRV